MKIHLEYRNPSPMHCDVAVFINGALTGTLRLAQTELLGFQQIVSAGCFRGIDEFIASGYPGPDPAGPPAPADEG